MRKIAIATCLLAACGGDPEIDPIEANHNVVALLPLTGAFAGKGPEHLRAIQKGIADLEEAGGLDKPIKLHIIDAADNAIDVNAERLAAQIEELTTADGVQHVAAILSSTTGAMKGAAPTALTSGIPFFEISSGSGLDEVTLAMEADRNYSFALRPLCMPEPIVTADLIAAKSADPDWASVYVLRGSQAHDKMHTREIRTGMAALGKSSMVINPEDVEMPNEGPFESFIDQAIAVQAQVIYYHLNGDTYNLAFLRAAERQGFTGKIVTCGMARRPSLLNPTDPGISPYLSGGSGGNPGTGTEGRLFFAMRGPVPSTGYDSFKTDFKTFSGYDADTFSPSGYDAAVLIGLGIAAAGTSEPVALKDSIQAVASGGTKFGYGQLTDALAAAKAGTDIDLDGTSGSLDLAFDPVLGNVAVGRYYFETVMPNGAEYKYETLSNPDTIK